jgi:hypothetical protein
MVENRHTRRMLQKLEKEYIKRQIIIKKIKTTAVELKYEADENLLLKSPAGLLNKKLKQIQVGKLKDIPGRPKLTEQLLVEKKEQE